jgi:hypothetical protein
MTNPPDHPWRSPHPDQAFAELGIVDPSLGHCSYCGTSLADTTCSDALGDLCCARCYAALTVTTTNRRTT